MKKFFGKTSAFLLVVVVLVTALALFVACGKDRPLHIWSEEWSNNAEYHWHACTDAGCPGKDQYAYHDFSLIETKKVPSCSEVGRGKYKCGTCGYEKEDDIAKLPHTWELESTLLQPTCYTQGRGTFKCTECGAHQDMPIEPTGEHNFVEYAHDATGHWKTCSTEGCHATTESEPHNTERTETTQPQGWLDGAIDHYCTICDALVSSEAVPSALAPASFDMVFHDGNNRISYTQRGEEDGIPAYDITLEVGKEYLIRIENALNGKGEEIDITDGDLSWDIPTLHGLKAYYINDRNAEVVLDYYDLDKPAGRPPIDYMGKSIKCRKEGAYKLIFRYETGVNDTNYHNRKIRVSKIFYINAVPKASAASASQKSAGDYAPYDLGECGGEDLFYDSKKQA